MSIRLWGLLRTQVQHISPDRVWRVELSHWQHYLLIWYNTNKHDLTTFPFVRNKLIQLMWEAYQPPLRLLTRKPIWVLFLFSRKCSNLKIQGIDNVIHSLKLLNKRVKLLNKRSSDPHKPLSARVSFDNVRDTQRFQALISLSESPLNVLTSLNPCWIMSSLTWG